MRSSASDTREIDSIRTIDNNGTTGTAIYYSEREAAKYSCISFRDGTGRLLQLQPPLWGTVARGRVMGPFLLYCIFRKKNAF